MRSSMTWRKFPTTKFFKWGLTTSLIAAGIFAFQNCSGFLGGMTAKNSGLSSLGAPAPSASSGTSSICGAIDMSATIPDGGNSYHVLMDGGSPTDTNESRRQTPFMLNENGKPLGPGHNLHLDIIN